MYLHLGSETLVRRADIIGLFDLDTTTVSATGRAFLNAVQARGEITPVGEDLPKSFVLTQAENRIRVYLSPLATTTLLKRTESELY